MFSVNYYLIKKNKNVTVDKIHTKISLFSVYDIGTKHIITNLNTT